MKSSALVRMKAVIDDFLDKLRLIYMLYVKKFVKIFLSAPNSDSTMR